MKANKFFLLVCISVLSILNASDLTFGNQLVNNEEIKKALAKVITNQKQFKFNQEYLHQEVELLKQEIAALEKQLKAQRNININATNAALPATNLEAFTFYPYTNIRTKPNINSEIKRIVKKDNLILIEKCEPNQEDKVWCKILNKEEYIRNSTINFRNKH